MQYGKLWAAFILFELLDDDRGCRLRMVRDAGRPLEQRFALHKTSSFYDIKTYDLAILNGTDKNA